MEYTCFFLLQGIEMCFMVYLHESFDTMVVCFLLSWGEMVSEISTVLVWVPSIHSFALNS